jgi:predicted nucleic acid-binding protein
VGVGRIAVKRDQYHSVVITKHQELQRVGRRYVTTDFVVSELISYLYGVGPSNMAEAFIESLFSAFDRGTYQLVHLSNAQFRRAWGLRQKYSDKPDISFVDFTSMVVMQDLGIAEVFSGDEHFVQVNLGFRLVPERE